MKAVTVAVGKDGSRKVQLDSAYPKPEPCRGEALIEVTLAGICGTDLEILEGYKELHVTQVLGHEFVGRIAKLGTDLEEENSSSFAVGDRVVAEINCVPPGCCSSRNASERAQDPTRTALGIFGRDGAFAEFVCVPVENLHKVPNVVRDWEAVFVEPVAAACQILEQIQIPGSHKVAVLGAGKLGWLVSAVLLASGKNVSVITRTRRDRADFPDAQVSDEALAKAFQANLVTLNDEQTVSQYEHFFDEVVDCTGNPAGLRTAIRLVKPRGTIVLKSTTAPSQDSEGIDLTPVVVQEIRIVGSRCGPFPVALRLLEQRRLQLDGLLRDIVSADQAEKAFHKAKERGSLKMMIQFRETTS